MPVDSTFMPSTFETEIVSNTYIKKPAYSKPETKQEQLLRLKREKRYARTVRNGKARF